MYVIRRYDKYFMNDKYLQKYKLYFRRHQIIQEKWIDHCQNHLEEWFQNYLDELFQICLDFLTEQSKIFDDGDIILSISGQFILKLFHFIPESCFGE